MYKILTILLLSFFLVGCTETPPIGGIGEEATSTPPISTSTPEIDLSESYVKIDRDYIKANFSDNNDLSDVIIEKVMNGENPQMSEYSKLGYSEYDVLASYYITAEIMGFDVGETDDVATTTDGLIDLTEYNKIIIRGVKHNFINEEPIK